MTEEIAVDEGNSAPVATEPPITPKKPKRDIFRFNGDRPTGINLDHVTFMQLEGKKITFNFYTTAVFVELLNDEAAASAFESLLTIWSSEK